MTRELHPCIHPRTCDLCWRLIERDQAKLESLRAQVKKLADEKKHLRDRIREVQGENEQFRHKNRALRDALGAKSSQMGLFR